MDSSPRLKSLVGLAMILILAGFVTVLLALGNRTLRPGRVIHLDFDYTENLKEGAAVRISALHVGHVLAIRQGVGPDEPPALAGTRVDVWLARDTAHFVHENSVFYVNSGGPIGERYLEVGPPADTPGPQVQAGAVYRGVDPPALDRLVQYGYRNLTASLSLFRVLQPAMAEFSQARARVEATLNRLAPPQTWRDVQTQAQVTFDEASALWQVLAHGTHKRRLPLSLGKTLRQLWLTHGPAIRQTFERAEVVGQTVDQLADLLGPEQRQEFTLATRRFKGSATRAAQLASSLLRLWHDVEQGKGTVGRFLTDPQIVDEIKETHRILKESPWRALARPPQDKAPRGRAPPRGSSQP